jgi:hypothetical protein
MISLALVASTNGEEKKAGCNFDAYRPLRIGTPIRGSHEELALVRVNPVYSCEALSKGVGGRVIVHVLINRAGDVVKACGSGPALLATSAEEALSKWKFRKDFGFGFAESSPATVRYAELAINFDFDAGTGQVQMSIPASPALCGQRAGSATDENGKAIWLSSGDLMRRAADKTGLTFPMLDHGHLHGEVTLDLRIDDRGRVECAEATSGHPIAIAAAMAAIRNWRFEPYVRDGKRAPVLGHLTIAYDSAR